MPLDPARCSPTAAARPPNADQARHQCCPRSPSGWAGPARPGAARLRRPASRRSKPLPSMAVVLGYPGFWLGDPATTVDAVRLVHGEQSLVLHTRPGGRRGRRARRASPGSSTRAPARARCSTREKPARRATGELLATAAATTFLRGDGGFGGSAGPVKPAAHNAGGAAGPRRRPADPARAGPALRLNGDDNPLHADPASPQRPGSRARSCTGSALRRGDHALLRGLCAYDPVRLRSLDLRFSAPVFPGETIRTEIFRDGSSGRQSDGAGRGRDQRRAGRK